MNSKFALATLPFALLFVVSSAAAYVETVTCEPTNRAYLDKFQSVIGSWFGSVAERQARARCIESLCPRPVVERVKESAEDEAFRVSQNRVIERALAKHDSENWNDLREIDRAFRGALGKYPVGEAVAGASAVSANALLLLSLSILVADEENPGGGGTGAQIDKILRGFPKLSEGERQRLVANFELVARLDERVAALGDVKATQIRSNPKLQRAALLSVWDRQQSQLREFQKTMPDAFRSQFEFGELMTVPQVIRDARDQRAIDGIMTDRLVQKMSRAQVWMTIHRTPELARNFSTVPTVDKFVSEKRFAGAIYPSAMPSEILAEARRCRRSLESAFLASPTETELSNARSTIEEFRGRAIEKWSKRFSTESAIAIKERAMKAEVRLPIGRRGYVPALLGRLIFDTEDSRTRVEAFKKFLVGQPRSNLIVEAYALDWYRPEKQASRIVLCSEPLGATGSDDSSVANIRSGIIKLSEGAVTNVNQLAHTVAHEFDHIVDPANAASAGFRVSSHSKGVRSAIGQCLLEQHGGDLPTFAKYDSIEDFADLSLPIRRNLGYCGVVKSEGGRITKESGFDAALHSPPTFLLLHEAFRASGRLNETCQAYVGKYKKWKFKDCLASPTPLDTPLTAPLQGTATGTTTK